MADLEATVEWQGIEAIESFSGTLAHGITPGVFQITCHPQKKAPPVTGTLTLRYGKYKVEFKDCKIATASYQYNEAGEIIALNILDRRHRWQNGFISGIYNQRLDDGTLVQEVKGSKLAVLDTERKPQDLAKLLLEEMKETGFDAGELPNDTRPACEWDYANPARSLADLCEQIGSRVVLQTTGKVKLCKTGKGKELPSQFPYESISAEVDLANVPAEMVVIGDRVLWQVDLELEAVGMEKDETIKLLDDLSYKPATGWSNDKTHSGIADKDTREAAKRTVFKMYRIKGPVTLSNVPPNVEKTIKNLDLILPLIGVRGETKTDTTTKKKLPQPAVCYGKHYFKQDAEYQDNIAKKPQPGVEDINAMIVREGFSIDETRGIVTFGNQVISKVNDRPAPAEIYLRCCVGLRSEKTGQFYRYERYKKTGKSDGNSPPLIIRRQDISVLVKRDKTSNQKDAEREADYYIDAKVKEITQAKPQMAEYTGWHDIELDGAIQSISWSMNQGGASMVVQRNNDPGSPTTLPYNQRRNLENLKAITAVIGGAATASGAQRLAQMDRGWNSL